MGTDDIELFVEVNFYIFSKSGRVIISSCLCISNCFHDWRWCQNAALNVCLTLSIVCASITSPSNRSKISHSVLGTDCFTCTWLSRYNDGLVLRVSKKKVFNEVYLDSMCTVLNWYGKVFIYKSSQKIPFHSFESLFCHGIDMRIKVAHILSSIHRNGLISIYLEITKMMKVHYKVSQSFRLDYLQIKLIIFRQISI